MSAVPPPFRRPIATVEDTEGVLSLLQCDALNEPPESALARALQLGRNLAPALATAHASILTLDDLVRALGATLARLVHPEPDLALIGLRDDAIVSELQFETPSLLVRVELAQAMAGHTRVIGEVLDLHGDPYVDARLRCFCALSATAISTTTDEAGTFSLSLTKGSWQIAISTDRPPTLIPLTIG